MKKNMITLLLYIATIATLIGLFSMVNTPNEITLFSFGFFYFVFSYPITEDMIEALGRRMSNIEMVQGTILFIMHGVFFAGISGGVIILSMADEVNIGYIPVWCVYLFLIIIYFWRMLSSLVK